MRAVDFEADGAEKLREKSYAAGSPTLCKNAKGRPPAVFTSGLSDRSAHVASVDDQVNNVIFEGAAGIFIRYLHAVVRKHSKTARTIIPAIKI
jgi:hypothetical protein